MHAASDIATGMKAIDRSYAENDSEADKTLALLRITTSTSVVSQSTLLALLTSDTTRCHPVIYYSKVQSILSILSLFCFSDCLISSDL